MVNVLTNINGRSRSFEVQPNELLLDFLRDRVGLTGAKKSCEIEICGSCTVLLDGLPVSSCALLALEMDGRRVTTIEGLTEGGETHPVQEAFVRHSALQCGFCTPGMVLSIASFINRHGGTTRPDCEQILDDNICRCTGYVPIIDVLEDLLGTDHSST